MSTKRGVVAMLRGEDYRTKLERVCKWRAVFAAMQLGTRKQGDSEFQAVKDQRELIILLRIETTALVALLVEKGVITISEFQNQLGYEADALNEAFSQRFPGARAELDGIHYDFGDSRLAAWLARFPA